MENNINKKGAIEITPTMATILIIMIVFGAVWAIWSSIVPMVKNQYPYFTITDNKGNEVDFVIKIVDCTLDIPVGSDFYINDEYVKAKRYYFEKVNETYGKACWYDAFKKESINSTWLDENCVGTENHNTWSCDKGFIVR